MAIARRLRHVFRCACLANGFLARSGDDWKCDRGYSREGDTCRAVLLPANAYLNGSGDGGTASAAFSARATDVLP